MPQVWSEVLERKQTDSLIQVKLKTLSNAEQLSSHAKTDSLGHLAHLTTIKTLVQPFMWFKHANIHKDEQEHASWTSAKDFSPLVGSGLKHQSARGRGSLLTVLVQKSHLSRAPGHQPALGLCKQAGKKIYF